MKKARNGSAFFKSVTIGFPDLPSVSTIMDLVLHSVPEGNEWHSYSCFTQLCDPSQCGSEKFKALFEPLLYKLADQMVEYHEHEKKIYQKADGSNATKWELVVKTQTLTTVVNLLHDRMFLSKEPYLIHSMRKCLGVRQRHNLRRNIGDKDLIIYSDFSKELEIVQPEQLKSEAFGSSHKTFQVLPQVLELTALPPSSPRNLVIRDTNISFMIPEYLGGTRIQKYEIHVQPDTSDEWFFFCDIPPKPLSDEPDIPTNVFVTISGHLLVRVCAGTMAGIGSCSETSVVFSGSKQFEADKYKHIEENHFDRKPYLFSLLF